LKHFNLSIRAFINAGLKRKKKETVYSRKIYVNPLTSIDDEVENMKFEMYPNPAVNELQGAGCGLALQLNFTIRREGRFLKNTSL